MGSFERAGNRSMPETGREKGFKAMGISIVHDTRTDHQEGGPRITYEIKREEQLWEQGCTRELGFDPVELWVMGPPCG